MTHPLTEKMIEEMSYLVEMSPWYEKYPDDYEHDCRVVGMRSAYDLALEHVNELWIEAQQEDDPVDVLSHFESNLRLLFINKFLRSQQLEGNQ